MTAHIYWNVSPELIQLGPLAIRWYGVLFAVGFVCGYYIVRWQFSIEGKDQASLDRLLGYMMAGTVVGARLGHCLFYQPAYYLNHPIEVFEIWRGGLASHGGAAGILIALHFYSRRQPDQPYLWLLDRIVVPTALAGAFIRVGNLFNSEILGTPAQVSWAFVFAREDLVPRHPVQLYEAIGYGLIFLVLLGLYRRYQAQTPRGLLLGVFLVAVFTFRFFIEFFKERQADYGQGLPISVGQWLSIPFVIVGLWLLARALRAHAQSARNPPRV